MHIRGTILKNGDLTVSNGGVYINARKNNDFPGMLLLHADYCSHCHVFIPTFNQIESKLGDTFKCMSIESKELSNKSVVKTLNFRGYPTILFFDKSGRIIANHDGPRDSKTILGKICQVYHHCA